MKALFIVKSEFYKILLAELYLVFIGFAILSSLNNINTIYWVLILCLILFVCYIFAGNMYRFFLFYKEGFIFIRPLFNSHISFSYDEIEYIDIKHVYRAGPKVIIWFKHRINGMKNTQFDYKKKEHDNLLKIFIEAGIKIKSKYH